MVPVLCNLLTKFHTYVACLCTKVSICGRLEHDLACSFPAPGFQFKMVLHYTSVVNPTSRCIHIIIKKQTCVVGGFSPQFPVFFFCYSVAFKLLQVSFYSGIGVSLQTYQALWIPSFFATSFPLALEARSSEIAV